MVQAISLRHQNGGVFVCISGPVGRLRGHLGPAPGGTRWGVQQPSPHFRGLPTGSMLTVASVKGGPCHVNRAAARAVRDA